MRGDPSQLRPALADAASSEVAAAEANALAASQPSATGWQPMLAGRGASYLLTELALPQQDSGTLTHP